MKAFLGAKISFQLNYNFEIILNLQARHKKQRVTKWKGVENFVNRSISVVYIASEEKWHFEKCVCSYSEGWEIFELFHYWQSIC